MWNKNSKPKMETQMKPTPPSKPPPPHLAVKTGGTAKAFGTHVAKDIAKAKQVVTMQQTPRPAKAAVLGDDPAVVKQALEFYKAVQDQLNLQSNTCGKMPPGFGMRCVSEQTLAAVQQQPSAVRRLLPPPPPPPPLPRPPRPKSAVPMLRPRSYSSSSSGPVVVPPPLFYLPMKNN
jgi:hypothetical protein